MLPLRAGRPRIVIALLGEDFRYVGIEVAGADDGDSVGFDGHVGHQWTG